MKSTFTQIEIITLQNRKISYRRVGTGKRKILFFHGFPGSSIQIEPFRHYAEQFDLEVVCLDRPGYHQSAWQIGRQFEQATNAAWDLLKHLGWNSCELVSVSGGTPFLFHFVQTHSLFVNRVSIVSGLGPLVGKDFSKILNWKMRWALKVLPILPGGVFQKILPKGNARGTKKFNIIGYLLPVSRADQEVMKDVSIQNILGQAVHEAFRQNGKGPQRDAQAYTNMWNLHLGEYQGSIDIWHGSDDQILPVEMAKLVAQALPNSRLHIAEGDGHYSLAFSKMKNILEGNP